jgi:hypothetical protein
VVVDAEVNRKGRPLFGVNGVVCPKKEKREQKMPRLNLPASQRVNERSGSLGTLAVLANKGSENPIEIPSASY